MSDHPATEAKLTGFTYIPKYISTEAADQMMAKLMADTSWVGVGSAASSRQVIHYGYQYLYTGRGALEKIADIPDYLTALVRGRGLPPFDQLIINKYLAGQGIGAHVDHVGMFGPMIACITLGGGCNIIFKHGNTVVQHYVEPGSLYIMSSDARYKWTHQIEPVKSDIVNGRKIKRDTRISLTYRTVNRAM